MRRPSFSGLVLTCVLAGCATEPPTGPVAELSNPQFSASARPLSARCQLAIQPPQPISPGVLRQLDTGECIVSHLGKSTLVSDKVINFAAGTQVIDVTFAAANGDVLKGSGTGTNTLVAPGRVAFTANLTFTGGTGRFANASGAAKIEGEADIVNARSQMTMTGSLTY